MSNEVVSLIIDEKTKDKIIKSYQSYQINSDGEYVVFKALYKTISITIYTSKKGRLKVIFMGEGALLEAKKYDKSAEVKIKKKTGATHYLDLNEQIGSDEVGVGDFFLPMIVVATYISKENMNKLLELGIKDSKKMNDKQILELVPTLIKYCSYSKLTLPNEKYSDMYLENENLNSLKAKMHNRALLNMVHSHKQVNNIYVDEFVNERKYYSYLNDENEEMITNITFKTKGESYYPSVALASLIARYSLLKEKEKLEEKYHLSFPFGAGSITNSFAIKFIDKYGINEFNKLVKKNFINYKEIISSLNK